MPTLNKRPKFQHTHLCNILSQILGIWYDLETSAYSIGSIYFTTTVFGRKHLF